MFYNQLLKYLKNCTDIFLFLFNTFLSGICISSLDTLIYLLKVFYKARFILIVVLGQNQARIKGEGGMAPGL